jgi:serine/threonine protein kinase
LHAVALPEGFQHLLEFAKREPARTKGQLMLASDAGGSLRGGSGSGSLRGSSGSDATLTRDDSFSGSLRGGSGSGATPTPDDSFRELRALSRAELNPGLSAALDQAASVLRLTDEAYGEFEVQKTLGRGSFGVISLLCERSSGTLVVCKELSVQGMRTRELRQAAAEVALQASLRHPHILPILGVHEQPGTLRLILQYAPLGSLEERISMYVSSGWVFSQSEVSRWVGQAAAALQYMHGQRILHRDLSTTCSSRTLASRAC